MIDPQYEPVFWPGSGSTPVGRTPLGIYDDDDNFTDEAPRLADWAARRLGYPIMAVELTDTMMYACFEEAITEYSAQVNEFNMRDNLLTYQGMSTGSTLTQKLVRMSPIPSIIELSAAYGTEVGAGGYVNWKRAAVPLKIGQQIYDLNTLIADVSESGSRIEIRKVFHDTPAAIGRIFDPFAMSSMGTNGLMGAFGWSGYAVEGQYLLAPMYETLLRTQAIEFNDLIRRSAYTFELKNNKLSVFPIPDFPANLWLEYLVTKDKFNPQVTSGVVSDYSNAPFANMMYTNINDVGKRWIRRYMLALCKETLGNVRSKYQSIPIPNSEMRMDGETLRQEAQAEKDVLWDQLRESLQESGRSKQIEKMAENEERSQDMLRRIPNFIYIG